MSHLYQTGNDAVLHMMSVAMSTTGYDAPASLTLRYRRRLELDRKTSQT
ncbi:MAG: hypothetical protein V7K40_01710 [Nostoc sp.]